MILFRLDRGHNPLATFSGLNIASNAAIGVSNKSDYHITHT